MIQIKFEWYDRIPTDLKTMLNEISRNDAKLQKKQKQEQKALKAAQRFQARLRKCK
ncbi:MAG: hypothetical protein QXX12_05190 [Nanopusillaceae archaeon]